MAVMEEEDLDAVAEAWGGEDEELVPGEPTQGLNEDMEGFEDAGANGEEDEEGGWDMEVTALSALYCSVPSRDVVVLDCISCSDDDNALCKLLPGS